MASGSAARLPTNTHGGQLSEAYIHGMNGVNEGVRLIRGTSTNQPEKNDHVLVTAGVGVPTSAMILGQVASSIGQDVWICGRERSSLDRTEKTGIRRA